MADQIRQGDVLLVRLGRYGTGNSWSIGNTQRLSNPVLATGEKTGHAHVLEADDVDLVETSDGSVFVGLKGAAVLRHDEHPAVDIPPGNYRVRRQREYRPEDAPRPRSEVE